MSISLHTAIIETYQQILPKVADLVTKAEEHCREQGQEAAALTEACLAPDMWPFAKQIFECGHHSARAIEGVRAGVFSPEPDPVASDFASLHKQIADSMALVDSVAPDELDSIADRDMTFIFRDTTIPFTVSDFLFSFSLPNFFFHSTTAFNILRNNGIAIGKADFMGRLRIKA